MGGSMKTKNRDFPNYDWQREVGHVSGFGNLNAESAWRNLKETSMHCA